LSGPLRIHHAQPSRPFSPPAFQIRPQTPAAYTRPSAPSRSRLQPRPSSSLASRLLSPGRRRLASTQTANASSHAGQQQQQQQLSLSQRLKKLTREYGWSALGVYLALTALDFPFCFLAVKFLGTDRIGHWEHVVLSYVKAAAKWALPWLVNKGEVDNASGEVGKIPLNEEEAARGGGREQKRVLAGDHTYQIQDHGYKEAEQASRGKDAGEVFFSSLSSYISLLVFHL